MYLWNESETFREAMQKLGQDFINTYNEHIKPTVDNIMDILNKLWNDVLSPLIQILLDTFAPIFEKVFIGIGKVIATVFDKVAAIIKTITGIFSGLIDFITGVFSGDWKKAWDGIVKVFGNIFDGIKEVFKTPINWIIGKLNEFLAELRKVKIPDWVPGVGGKGIDIPDINYLATGGIVTSPTLAMVGEGRSAEAVIPLDRTLTKYLAEAMRQVRGVGSIVLNFYPQQVTEAELDRAFAYVDRRFGLAY